jgi:hypothetical protein
MDHDPMCPRHESNRDPVWGFGAAGECRCEEYARVRADEQERVFSGVLWRHAVGAKTYSVECLTGRDDECAWCLCFCHAEAVAAKLVEVICEQEREWENAMQWQEESNEQWIETLDKTRAERDAARAKVAQARKALAEHQIELDRQYAEVAALRDDLRAKAKFLPHDRKCDVLKPAYGGRGKVMCTCGLTDAFNALLDKEADHD